MVAVVQPIVASVAAGEVREVVKFPVVAVIALRLVIPLNVTTPLKIAELLNVDGE
jgi:hypothetical protein